MTEPAFIDRYRKRFADTWRDDTPLDRVRFVVLDSETTGLNPRADRLVTIGAVAVQNGEIVLDDSFHALIKVDENTSAVTVHGVTRDESRAGVEEPEALARFLDYLGDGVIVEQEDSTVICTNQRRERQHQPGNRVFPMHDEDDTLY